MMLIWEMCVDYLNWNLNRDHCDTFGICSHVILMKNLIAQFCPEQILKLLTASGWQNNC